MRVWRLLTGPEDIGQSVWFWLGFALVVAFLVYYANLVSEFDATNIAYYLLQHPDGARALAALGLHAAS